MSGDRKNMIMNTCGESDQETSLSSLITCTEETLRQNLGLLWCHLREHRGARKRMVSSTIIAASIILLN